MDELPDLVLAGLWLACLGVFLVVAIVSGGLLASIIVVVVLHGFLAFLLVYGLPRRRRRILEFVLPVFSLTSVLLVFAEVERQSLMRSRLPIQIVEMLIFVGLYIFYLWLFRRDLFRGAQD